MPLTPDQIAEYRRAREQAQRGVGERSRQGVLYYLRQNRRKRAGQPYVGKPPP